MRAHRAGMALLAALVLVLAVSGGASATATGINIAGPALVVQRGTLTFNSGGLVISCNTTLLKRLTLGLTLVRAGLIRLGKIRAGRLAAGCPNETAFLNLPLNLAEGMPGPMPESWDISYLSSNLPGGQLNFGILDVQIRTVLPGTQGCLYRGTLLGTLSTDGRVLRYGGTLPLAEGFACPAFMGITGTFNNEPAIVYSLLLPN